MEDVGGEEDACDDKEEKEEIGGERDGFQRIATSFAFHEKIKEEKERGKDKESGAERREGEPRNKKRELTQKEGEDKGDDARTGIFYITIEKLPDKKERRKKNKKYFFQEESGRGNIH